MQPGRTPNWNLVADFEESAWLEAVQLASDDRLPLPAALRRCLTWCAPEASLPLLASIGSDGGVQVRPLSAQQDELKAIKAALAEAEPANRGSMALTAMATYYRIPLQPDGRLRLPPALALHLCSVAGGRVWVGAHSDVITLWSEKAWSSFWERSSEELRQAVAIGRGTA
jgi:DNA-binding transcriptional regulator/RsmH inhibitor MraZ